VKKLAFGQICFNSLLAARADCFAYTRNCVMTGVCVEMKKICQISDESKFSAQGRILFTARKF
jgi:hypothetical protein